MGNFKQGKKKEIKNKNKKWISKNVMGTGNLREQKIY